MMYYVKDNVLFCCETIITDEYFFPITKEEYIQRLEAAVSIREKGNSCFADTAED